MEKVKHHIYSFYNSRINVSVKAKDIIDAIEWLKIVFGEKWVKDNIINFDIHSSINP